jgi:anti-sigma regulatory factor (Ser/Thr protein kinase)
MSGSTANGGPIPELELDIPAKPMFVRTARHAVAALARLHDLPEDLIEDIKLAVSEACNTALATTEGGEADPSRVQVSVWIEGGRILIDVFDPQGRIERDVAGAPGDIATEDLPFDQLLALPIIRGLVDEMAITAEETGGVRTRMWVSVPPREE